jgi:uncharacterized protein YndB with AHSA1/START domain
MSTTEIRQEFSITRTFNAPRALVWQAWTEAERLAQWWGPKGCTIRIITFDMRPGGVFHYAMAFQPGQDMYGRFIYGDITAPSRLVFISSFADEAGDATRVPFAPNFPLEVHNTMTLTEENGRTTLRLRGWPINPTDAEYETYLGMFPSMQQGFGGTFDKLDAHLANP